jgi:hypothetical protein
MKALFFMLGEDYRKIKNKLLADDLVSRQSLNFRESKALGFEKEGYYLEIEGSEKGIKKAKEIIGELGKEVKGKGREEVSKRIQEQEESAAEGFGSIFG